MRWAQHLALLVGRHVQEDAPCGSAGVIMVGERALVGNRLRCMASPRGLVRADQLKSGGAARAEPRGANDMAHSIPIGAPYGSFHDLAVEPLNCTQNYRRTICSCRSAPCAGPAVAEHSGGRHGPPVEGAAVRPPERTTANARCTSSGDVDVATLIEDASPDRQHRAARLKLGRTFPKARPLSFPTFARIAHSPESRMPSAHFPSAGLLMNSSSFGSDGAQLRLISYRQQ